MYTGHFAVALGASGAARRIPLALLVAAAFGSDLVEGALAAFNVNDPSRVWSHSLPAAAALGAVLALGWRAFGGTWREAGVVLLVAMTHTGLDLVTARKAWWPGEPRVGLMLYARPLLDAAVEGTMVVLAWLAWRGSVDPSRRGSRAVWGMLATLLAAQVAAMLYFKFGPGADLSALSKFVR